MLLSDENLADQKYRRRLSPGFAFLTPSYIIPVANDKKSLGGRPGSQDRYRGSAPYVSGRYDR
jgi:hypothetical protein